MTRLWRLLRLAVVVLPLLLTAYNGLVEGVNATQFADTIGMRWATATQLSYGVLGSMALVAIVLRPSWVAAILIGWGIALVGTGLLAPVVYAGKPVRDAFGIAAAVLAAVSIVIWAWQRHAATMTT